MSSVDAWMTYYQARAATLPGAGTPWLDALRKQAIDRFCAVGWPTSRQDGWRHTSLALLQQQEFNDAVADANTQSVQEQLADLRRGEAGHWLVFINGGFVESLSDIGALPQGAVVMPVSQALDAHSDQVQALTGTEEDGPAPATLNTALAGDGGFVSVARGVDLSEPVHLVFFTVGNGNAVFPRNLISVEQGARATVVEHYLCADAGTDADAAAILTNAVTRTQVARDASLTHMKLQVENEQAYHLAFIDAKQDEASVFNSHSMSFGARLARNDISTQFGGKHCETLFNGLFYVNARRHADHNTLIDHAHPDGVSREYYRGILADAGRGVFGGRIRVAPGADGTDAVQRCDSLLLSRMARSDARPELEIYADDVQCAHGATVGQIDEDALFYLRTRGLDDTHAHNLLTYAFAAEVIERISLPGLRDRVTGLIRERLPGGAVLGDI